VKDSLLIACPKLATPLPPLNSIPAPVILKKLSSELYIKIPSCVTSTLLELLLTEKLSNVISVSGYSAVALPFTSLVNFLPLISELTVPLSPAKSGFSILKPVSSFIEPVKTTLTNSAGPGKSAEAPKLLY